MSLNSFKHICRAGVTLVFLGMATIILSVIMGDTFALPTLAVIQKVVGVVIQAVGFGMLFLAVFIDPLNKDGKPAAKDVIRWIPVGERLPDIDEEVIALTDVVNGTLIPGANRICFAHRVNTEICIDYDGWNIAGVKYWMPSPDLPYETEKKKTQGEA